MEESHIWGCTVGVQEYPSSHSHEWDSMTQSSRRGLVGISSRRGRWRTERDGE
jgi:hypothetical protein